MIEQILPPQVAAAEVFLDGPGCALFPEEEAVIAGAVASRRREFSTARACARTALAKLGLPAVPIVPGPWGAPRWPPGVVGSITHCAGYRASAVAHGHELLTIGLDAEPHEKLPSGVLRHVASDDEQRRLAALASARPGVCWDRILFSAKESVYKAWFPLARRWLGFADASVSIGAYAGTFSAELLATGPEVDGVVLAGFEGRWLVSRGLIVTAIAVPRVMRR